MATLSTSHPLKVENLLLITGAIVFLIILSMPNPDGSWSYLDTLRSASATLRGSGYPSDIMQDFVGFRALVKQEDPYPVLGPAFEALGINWDVKHVSTHPPTVYILTAPVAFLPWKLASMLWAYLMIILIMLSLRFYDLPWKLSIGLTPIILLWPPAAFSLVQVTIIWLFGLAAGYRYKEKIPFLGGVGIGLAAITKILPGLVILPFILKTRWRIVIGFGSLIGISMIAVAILHPAAFIRFLEVNQTNSLEMFRRADNGSIFAIPKFYFGTAGVIFSILFVLLILIFQIKQFFKGEKDVNNNQYLSLTYSSLLLLPICWIYSILPLLPVAVSLIMSKNKIRSLYGLNGLIAPFLIFFSISTAQPLLS
jgi:hypothetical protein